MSFKFEEKFHFSLELGMSCQYCIVQRPIVIFQFSIKFNLDVENNIYLIQLRMKLSKKILFCFKWQILCTIGLKRHPKCPHRSDNLSWKVSWVTRGQSWQQQSVQFEKKALQKTKLWQSLVEKPIQLVYLKRIYTHVYYFGAEGMF